MPEQLTDQEAARRRKLKELTGHGQTAFPARVERSHRLIEVRDSFARLAEAQTTLSIVGRVRGLRLHGGSLFIDLDDGSARLQVFLTAEHLGHDNYERLTRTLDLGDFVTVSGPAFRTQRGEETVRGLTATIIAKAVRPLPEKRLGLADVEQRFRHRELDLIANDEARRTIELRGRMLTALREFVAAERFLEVETPILQSIPGGATARPFVTHHRALDVDLYLRVAPELYLKRLIIGGLERVFEVARCFRNEGLDHEHNPEFTQVELYAAYTDYGWMMDFTERLTRHIVQVVTGTSTLRHGDTTIDLAPPFRRWSFRDAIRERTGIDLASDPDDARLLQAARKLNLDLQPHEPRANLIDGVFKAAVRPTIVQPTFIVDHPIELSPLAKARSDDPRFVERFQLLIGQTELANAFSELNDPLEQRARFETQERLRQAGDEEAQRIDEDFLTALEYGMPPTSGLGLGLDRLAMLLTNQRSIKEVIAFPTLRPKP